MKIMKEATDFASYLTRFFSEYMAGIRNLSHNTITGYRDTFKLLLLFCNDVRKIKTGKLTISMIDDNLIIYFLNWLQHERKCSIPTRNQRLAAIHAFFRYLQAQEPEYLYSCQKILIIPFKKCPKAVIQHLTPVQISLLLKQPNVKTKSGRRDVTLLSVLYDTGARVQEVCDLRVRDIRIEKPPHITITGKGSKSRYVPLLGNTTNLLHGYMNENNLSGNGKQDMPLFYNQRRSSLTRGGISYILQKYVNKASSEWPDFPGKVTPHMLRHSKALHLLNAGINVVLIRDILGHESIQTTNTYIKVDIEEKRKTLESVYPNIIPESLPDWSKDDNLLSFLEKL